MEISSDSYEDDNFLIKNLPKNNINFGLDYNIVKPYQYLQII